MVHLTIPARSNFITKRSAHCVMQPRMPTYSCGSTFYVCHILTIFRHFCSRMTTDFISVAPTGKVCYNGHTIFMKDGGGTQMRYILKDADRPLLEFSANMQSSEADLQIQKIYEENRAFLPLNLTLTNGWTRRTTRPLLKRSIFTTTVSVRFWPPSRLLGMAAACAPRC